MASLFKRPRSRFWWIKFRDHSGRCIRQATPYSHLDTRDTRRAEILRAEKEVTELRSPRADDSTRWANWVVDYLRKRHAASPKTLERKLTIWRTLAKYLEETHLATPANVTREHCLNYLPWRRAKRSFRSKHHGVAHNTVLLELRVFHSILQEAVRRGWCAGNPCARLEIAKETVREKPELTDEQIQIIRGAIQTRLNRNALSEEERRNSQFLHISFEIAIAQGCRMSETHILLEDVDLKNMEITLLAKGRKRYTAPLNPALVPLFKELHGRTWTYEPPRMPSLVWFKFIDGLRRTHPGFARVSFHSTRVTVASRLGRGGVHERVAMAILNHASTTIHRIYRRVAPSEIRGAWQALGNTPKTETPDAPPTTPSPNDTSSAARGKKRTRPPSSHE